MADGQVKERMAYSRYASSRATSLASNASLRLLRPSRKTLHAIDASDALDATDARDAPPLCHSPLALAFQLAIPHQMHDIGLARSLLTVSNQQDGLPEFP